MMVGSGLEEYTDSQDEIQLEPLPNPSHNLPLDKEGLIPEDVLRELGRSLGSSSQLEASPDYNMRKEYNELMSQ